MTGCGWWAIAVMALFQHRPPTLGRGPESPCGQGIPGALDCGRLVDFQRGLRWSRQARRAVVGSSPEPQPARRATSGGRVQRWAAGFRRSLRPPRHRWGRLPAAAAVSATGSLSRGCPGAFLAAGRRTEPPQEPQPAHRRQPHSQPVLLRLRLVRRGREALQPASTDRRRSANTRSRVACTSATGATGSRTSRCVRAAGAEDHQRDLLSRSGSSGPKRRLRWSPTGSISGGAARSPAGAQPGHRRTAPSLDYDKVQLLKR